MFTSPSSHYTKKNLCTSSELTFLKHAKQLTDPLNVRKLVKIRSSFIAGWRAMRLRNRFKARLRASMNSLFAKKNKSHLLYCYDNWKDTRIIIVTYYIAMTTGKMHFFHIKIINSATMFWVIY